MNNKTVTSLRDLFRTVIRKKSRTEFTAWLGDAEGRVVADNNNGVYIIDRDGNVSVVMNNKVPPYPFRPVRVDYVSETNKVLEVKEFVDAYPTRRPPNVPGHATNHVWGGVDTMFIRGEQILPGVAIPGDDDPLVLHVAGFVYYLDGWHIIDTFTLDVTSYIPASGANFILLEADAAGAITVQEGASKGLREALVMEDIPTPSAGKVPLVAVIVYAGQVQIWKTLTKQDVVDLRWSRYATGMDTSITAPLYAGRHVAAADPTVTDDDTEGFLTLCLWLNSTTGDRFICTDNSTGAAVWEPLTGGGGGPASSITVADAGGYFAGTNVEDVLQELGLDGRSFATIVASMGTTTLNAASPTVQMVTGTSLHTVDLPDTSTIFKSKKFHIINRSTQVVPVRSSTGVALLTLGPGADSVFVCTSTADNLATSWKWTLVSEDMLVFSDIGTAESDTTKHGLLRKLSGSATEFLNGIGNWVNATTAVLTGFTAGAGTVSATDTILQALQKIVGNIALKLTANAAITAATKTKITYDANGLVTAGANLAASDIGSGTPDNTSFLRGDLTWQKLTDVLGASGDNATVPASSTYYISPYGGLTAVGGGTAYPKNGTLKNFYLITTTTQPASGSLVFTLQVAGVDTSIVITVAAGAGSAVYSDTTHTVAYTGGGIRWKVKNNATAASAGVAGITVGLES